MNRPLLWTSSEHLHSDFGSVVVWRGRTRPQLHCQQLVLAVENRCILRQIISLSCTKVVTFLRPDSIQAGCRADPITVTSPWSTLLSLHLNILTHIDIDTWLSAASESIPSAGVWQENARVCFLCMWSDDVFRVLRLVWKDLMHDDVQFSDG